VIPLLPEILKIAEEHGLRINPRTYDKKEVMVKCPFCGHDDLPGKERKYHLSLNTEDQVFKCWVCKESGGVFRFIALLEGIPESDVIERYHHKKGHYKPHPAEKLTLHQCRLLGYKNKPNWAAMRKRDMEYHRRTRNQLWREWMDFMAEQKRLAYQLLVVGIQSMKYKKTIEAIKQMEIEISAPLLEDVLKIYSLPHRPHWAVEAEAFALHVANPKKYPWPSTEKKMKAAL
jgi:hypothetical protein